MIKALIMGIVIGLLLLTIFEYAVPSDVEELVPVTLENCTPWTWVGMVRWTDNKTDFDLMPAVELKETGTRTFMLSPGEYGITHFRPRVVVEYKGRISTLSPAILEFRDVEVENTAITFSFGCDGGGLK